MTYRGLTWDHPRGYDALAEAARRVNDGRVDPLINWDKQPLEGFESAPISDLAAANDLIVLDHPHIGEAVAEDCLIPLEDLYSRETISQWETLSIGPSLQSYVWENNTWALPLDVATQVVARRADRIGKAPTSWAEIEELSKRHPVALSLGGPHAFLNLISIAGSEGAVAEKDEMLDDDVAIEALERLARLAQLAPSGTQDANPIKLLEAMARGNDIALVPLIFGYVTYAGAGYAPFQVTFSDTPRSENGLGGVLGGTGIGFSRRCEPSDELLDHIASLMTTKAQTEFFPKFGGQPSARAAWKDPAVNQDWGFFYRDTADTAENALLRPRFDGYIAFQTAAAHRVRAALAEREDPQKTLFSLREIWREARSNARGTLDPKGKTDEQ